MKTKNRLLLLLLLLLLYSVNVTQMLRSFFLVLPATNILLVFLIFSVLWT